MHAGRVTILLGMLAVAMPVPVFAAETMTATVRIAAPPVTPPAGQAKPEAAAAVGPLAEPPVAAPTDDQALLVVPVTRVTPPSGPYQAGIERLGRDEADAAPAAEALVGAGAAALPALHTALADPYRSGSSGARILRILAAIGDPRSSAPIIEFAATRRSEAFLLKQAVNALRALPSAPEAQTFVDSLLGSALVAADIKRTALLYYAAHPDPRAMRWVIQYRSPGTDPAIRYIGLYLGAVLGDESVTRWIVELLDSGRPAHEQRYLLMGLAERLSLADFERRIAGFELSPEVRGEALRYARARRTDNMGVADTPAMLQDIPPLAVRTLNTDAEPPPVHGAREWMKPLGVSVLLLLVGVGMTLRYRRRGAH